MDRRAVIFVVALTLALLGVKYSFSFFEEKSPNKSAQTQVVQQKAAPIELTKPVSKTAQKEEKFFVLENNFVQLVFSNIGGSVVEINLPFKTKTNDQSIVLPIEFDRDIEKQSPPNAQFPLKPAKMFDGSINKGTIGGYYPLLRRNQLANNGSLSIGIQPRFYAFNIVSEYPEVATQEYLVKNFTKNSITFEATQNHRRITKTFSIPENAVDIPYSFVLDINVEGDSRGLWLTSGIPDVEWISGSPAPLVQYHLMKGSSSTVEKADLPKNTISYASTTPDWVANSNGFFSIIVDPTKGHEAGFTVEKVLAQDVPSRLSLIDREYNLFPINELPGYGFLIPLKTASQKAHFRIFSGPLSEAVLNKIDAYNAEHGERVSDYIACKTSHGWFSFISEPFAKFLFFLMVGSPGTELEFAL